ncbi:MAG TPA: O-antigen ligase family protein [Candidatus Dormibacteraeota bacterium]|nr:O-antigen ligase family protein [Candidatus Dormibacteraeota bacterium]
MSAFVVLGAIILALPWWVGNPIRGVYLLFAGALLFEIFPLGYADSLTDNVPFWWNLNAARNDVAVGGLPVTPAEVAMLLALIIWWVSSERTAEARMPRGRLVVAYAIFMVVVGIAEIRGLLSGGDLNISLWELRPQVYGFVMFVLAASLVRERGQLLRLAGLFFAAVGLKAIVGFYRYLVTLGGKIDGASTLLSHEESYFLAMFLIGVFVALIWYRKWRFLIPAIALSPLVGFVLLENGRRVGMLALWAAIVVLALIALRFEKPMRRWLVVGTAVIAICAGGFLATYWDHTYGTIGQIVRPVHSQFVPDEKDAQSNAYRDAENANMIATFSWSPLVGIGFGRPMAYIFPMADISNIYPFWNYIPHNTILWLAMRMGTIGLIAFWALIGMAILEAAGQMRVRKDALLRGVAAFAILAIIAELIVAWGDLQLENYRNMLFLGTILGIVDALHRVPDAQAQSADLQSGVPDSPTRVADAA